MLQKIAFKKLRKKFHSKYVKKFLVTNHTKYLVFFVCWAVCGVAALCGYFLHSMTYSNFKVVTNTLPKTLEKTIKNPMYFDVLNPAKSAHASAIVNIENLQIKGAKNEILQNMLLYFAGSREGASDVCIYQSFFSRQDFRDSLRQSHNLKQNYSWSEARAILCPQDLSKKAKKFIKKLGNPVSFVDTKGEVHLFVVGVSMGGWATSKIYWLKFDDSLTSLQFVRELPLSPILNFSHLVRNPAMLLENGGFVLPIYNEFAQKYPLLLYVDSKSHIKSIPISSMANATRNQLQPSFVALDSSRFFGVFRQYRGDNIMKVALCDSEVWREKGLRNRNTILSKIDKNECKILPSNLKNFDFSPVIFKMDFGLESVVLLLHNKAKTPKGNPREELWLYKLESNLQDSSLEAVTFVPIMKIDELEGREVSYPSVAQHSDFVHISYTYGREYIATSLLPKAYILKKLKEAK